MIRKKLRSEFQAWLYLARLWDKPKRWTRDKISKTYFVGTDDYPCFLLHNSIVAIYPIILRKIYRKVNQRLNLYLMPIFDHWPITKSGAKKRADFCRRMAQLAKLDENKGRR